MSECLSRLLGGGATIWNTHYTYDLAGDGTSRTLLSDGTKHLNYSVSVAQRVSQITSEWSDTTHPGTLATLTYWPFGAAKTLLNGAVTGGTQRKEAYDYNNRLQPVMIRLGTAASASANSCAVYNYYVGVSNPTSCAAPTQATTGNNGNVAGYFFQDNTSTPTPDMDHTSSYTYDNLNRLTNSTATGSQTHNLTFNYDLWGNATCAPGGSGLCTQMTYSTSTNRISTIGGGSASYDAGGNMTGDDLCTYTWDAEGHIKSVAGCATVSFTYNALGQRVEKKVGASTYTETAYDVSGSVIGFHNRTSWVQEFVPFGATPFAKYQDGVTRFVHGNHLGSTTFLTDHAGAMTQKTLAAVNRTLIDRGPFPKTTNPRSGRVAAATPSLPARLRQAGKSGAHYLYAHGAPRWIGAPAGVASR